MSFSVVRMDVLLPEYARLVQNQDIEVHEVNEGGVGSAVFELNGYGLQIMHFKDKCHLSWMKNRKCADGAIIVECEQGLCLHVIELKKTVTEKKWGDIKSQFDGMIQNVIAILAVLGLPRPSEVYCHIAYEADKLSPENIRNLSLLKLPIGHTKSQRNPALGASVEWTSNKISVGRGGLFTLRKIQRDPATGFGRGSLMV